MDFLRLGVPGQPGPAIALPGPLLRQQPLASVAPGRLKHQECWFLPSNQPTAPYLCVHWRLGNHLCLMFDESVFGSRRNSLDANAIPSPDHSKDATNQPTNQPSKQASKQPSNQATKQPGSQPANQPTKTGLKLTQNAVIFPETTMASLPAYKRDNTS